MRIPDLQASRAAPIEAEGLPAAPRLAGETERAVRADPETIGAWLRRKAPGVGFTTVFHALATVGFVILWRSMVQDVSAPEGTPVEIVSSIPGEGDAPKPAGAPAPAPAPEPAPKAADAPAPPPPPPPQSQADVLKQALEMPSAPPATPPPGDGPPPGAKDDSRSPLAQPPPEPKAAATQTQKNEKANTSEEATKTPTPPAPAPPPPAPAVMTAEGGDTTVPLPSQTDTTKTPAKAADPDASAKDSTAHLAAALPMSSLGLPTTFRAMLSSQGTSASQEYKGAVYGALSRAKAAMEGEAQRRRMKGQVVVLITVTDAGAIEKAEVVQSSGSDQTDAYALDMVRRAAPFPPPPPGTSHTFTPAISFGDE